MPDLVQIMVVDTMKSDMEILRTYRDGSRTATNIGFLGRELKRTVRSIAPYTPEEMRQYKLEGRPALHE